MKIKRMATGICTSIFLSSVGQPGSAEGWPAIDVAAKLEWGKTVGLLLDVVIIFTTLETLVSDIVDGEYLLKTEARETADLATRELNLDRSELAVLDEIGETDGYILAADEPHLATSEQIRTSISGQRAVGSSVNTGSWIENSLENVLAEAQEGVKHSPVPLPELKTNAHLNWEQDQALYAQIKAGASNLLQAETSAAKANDTFRAFEARALSAGTAADIKESADITAATAAEAGRTLAWQLRQSSLLTYSGSTHTLAVARDRIMSRTVKKAVRP